MVICQETSLVTVVRVENLNERDYKSYYPVSPARRVSYLLDTPRQPDESCGMAIVVSFFRIGSSRAISAQVTWGTWFGLVIGILSFRVLLGFGSTWDVPETQFRLCRDSPLPKENCFDVF